MRARTPRQRDPAYLGWVAQLPCVASMVRGEFRRGVHVAHLRMGSPAHGKRSTGAAEKPDDRWTTPLAPHFHVGDTRKTRLTQHAMSEERFWWELGICPFELCIALREAYEAGRAGAPVVVKFAAQGRRVIEGRSRGE